MSSEEGPELRDLIAQTLENNGILAKIRAELRASVFLALEEQEAFKNKLPFRSRSLKTFLKTSEGSLITNLVREFLEFFELDFTLSVFDSETFHGTEYSYVGRSKLMNDLQIKNSRGTDGPVLSCLLHSTVESQCIITNSLQEEPNKRELPKQENVQIEESGAQIGELSEKDTFLNKTEAESSAVLPVKSATIGETSGSTKLSAEKKNRAESVYDSLQLHVSSEPMGKGMEEPKNDPPCKRGNSLSSLSNLPPLVGPAGTNIKSLETHSVGNLIEINQTKMVINLGAESVDNYEEDFQSSVSASAQEGRSEKHTIPESDTEIEEDIGSGLDDLLSNASGMDELTVDMTATSTHIGADYMEDIKS